jgi:hypothetical protein
MGARRFCTQMPAPEELRFRDVMLSPLQEALDFLVLCLAAHEPQAHDALQGEKKLDKTYNQPC